MSRRTVLIAHASREECLAEQLAEPIRKAGYDVTHLGTVLVGQSVVEEASKALQRGGPIVLCGTVQALGTGWAHKLINAARMYDGIRVFAVQMEQNAYLQQLTLDDAVAEYWRDSSAATAALLASLRKYYPVESDVPPSPFQSNAAEQRYRELALESCDIIDLANLPESDRHLATRKLELRRLYVPLRVRVEAQSDEDEESALLALERSRTRTSWGRPELSTATLSASLKRVPVGERLATARRLVVLGDPGSGKSTLLRWIATAYLLRLKREPDWKDLPDVATLPDAPWLPIVIRCRDLDAETVDWTLDKVLRHTLRKSEMTASEVGLLRVVIQERLGQGNAILLVDGLDEIADAGARGRFCRQIEQIHVAYPNAPIVVTSRIVGYREMNLRIGRGFDHLTVSDLSPKDKDDFAQRWCHLTELPERRALAAAELIRDIHSTDRIELLTGNPMLLTTLALVKRKVGKLPRRRAELYWEAVQVLLNWRSEVDQPIDSREALPQLEYLAYAMCARGKQQLREDEVLELFEQMRNEYPQVYTARARTPVEFLHLLERRTGILIEAGHTRHQGATVPVFEFRHLTFQEYLAALGLVQGKFPNRDRSLSIADQIAPLAGQIGKSAEPWREALRLCVACANDDEVDALLGAIVTPIEEQESASRALLAVLCLADEPNTSEEVAQGILRELVGQIITSQLKPSNRDLMEIAGCLWAPPLCLVLYEQYVGSDAKSRQRLGEIYGALVAAKAPNSRLELTDWLLARIRSAPPGDSRTAIEVALCVHHFAVRSGTPISQEIADFLVSMFSMGSAAAFAAARALFRVVGAFQRLRPRPSGRRQDGPLLGGPQLALLSEHLSMEWAEPETARHVIAVLGLENHRSAAYAILPGLKSPDSGVSSVAALTLGKLDAGFAVNSLIELLSADDPKVRRSAIRGIALLTGREAREQAARPILLLLSDSVASVSNEAAKAIAQLAQPEMTEDLARALDTAVGKRAVGIIQALEKLRDPRAIPYLALKMTDGQKTRRCVARALGVMQVPEALPLLIQLENDPYPRVAAQARAARQKIESVLTGPGRGVIAAPPPE